MLTLSLRAPYRIFPHDGFLSAPGTNFDISKLSHLFCPFLPVKFNHGISHWYGAFWKVGSNSRILGQQSCQMQWTYLHQRGKQNSQRRNQAGNIRRYRPICQFQVASLVTLMKNLLKPGARDVLLIKSLPISKKSWMVNSMKLMDLRI